MVHIILFTFLGATALAIIRLRDLFAAAMLMGIFSLLSAGLFTVMDGVDVAFTEASVGAGISTILMLATLALTYSKEKGDRRGVSLPGLAVVVLTGGALVYGTLDMPAYGHPDGTPEAPISRHVDQYYIDHAAEQTEAPNMVTGVLASYRGYDTYGETTVIFTAAIGVMLLLGGRRRRKRPPVEDAT